VPGGVGDVFLDRADGDGAVPRLFDDAVGLAERVLRADAAAGLREGIGGLRRLVGFLQPALGGHPEPVGDVVVQGAMGLAIGHAALAAAACLLGRLLGGELAVDLVEILRGHWRHASPASPSRRSRTGACVAWPWAGLSGGTQGAHSYRRSGKNKSQYGLPISPFFAGLHASGRKKPRI